MKDSELMQLADGELDDQELPAEERAKVEAIGELGELVRGQAEMAADAVPQKRFDAMWREIDKSISNKTKTDTASQPVAAPAGFWRRLGRWFDQYRGHLITGAVSAGAVAALALVLRGPGGGGGDQPQAGSHAGNPNLGPAVYRPTEIESLDTPGGTGTVFDLKDEDGSTTVIWVTPNDTVEGL